MLRLILSLVVLLTSAQARCCLTITYNLSKDNKISACDQDIIIYSQNKNIIIRAPQKIDQFFMMTGVNRLFFRSFDVVGVIENRKTEVLARINGLRKIITLPSGALLLIVQSGDKTSFRYFVDGNRSINLFTVNDIIVDAVRVKNGDIVFLNKKGIVLAINSHGVPREFTSHEIKNAEKLHYSQATEAIFVIDEHYKVVAECLINNGKCLSESSGVVLELNEDISGAEEIFYK